MQIKEILKNISLGSSVAEFDEDLEKYFLETDTFTSLKNGKADLVAGDKGKGKSALYSILQKEAADEGGSEFATLVPAFNPTGNPVFQVLGRTARQADDDYIAIWKTYFFSLCANYLIALVDQKSKDIVDLENALKALGLASGNYEPKPIFERVVSKIGKLLEWNAVEFELGTNLDGSMTFKPRVELGKTTNDTVKSELVDIDVCLRLLDKCLSNLNITLWIVMDRLDEAFQGRVDIEIPALRGLFRTFLDSQELTNCKIKMFVRRDLFRRITDGGFVNLTHINARKVEIRWEEADLKNLLCKRIRLGEPFQGLVDIHALSDDDLFNLIFPDQVDLGSRKPKTWVWMMRRIRDGNDVKPPRNLIDLVTYAVQYQQRSESRQPSDYRTDIEIIEPESLRSALRQLSETRVNDTLLAEAKDYVPYIESFRGGKAEHNTKSVMETLKLEEIDSRRVIKGLVEIGFLEVVKGNWKIPTLYREGLEITQGKAFEAAGDDDEIEE